MVMSYPIDLDTEGKILCIMVNKDTFIRYAVSVFFVAVFALVAIFVFTRPHGGNLSLSAMDASSGCIRDAGFDVSSEKPRKSLNSSKSVTGIPDAGAKSKPLKPDTSVKSKSLKPDAGAKLLVSDAGARSKG